MPLISSVVFLSVAACGSRSPVDPKAANTAGLPEVNAPAPSASGESHGATTAAKADPQPAAAIPASLQGRWALAPRDCLSGPAAARGLLVISANQLQFNQSHAVPATEVNADAFSIVGNFAFSGDGRSWTKYEALKVDDRRLTRTEMNPTASFSYAKCS